jgi:hypothetical protein
VRAYDDVDHHHDHIGRPTLLITPEAVTPPLQLL